MHPFSFSVLIGWMGLLAGGLLCTALIVSAILHYRQSADLAQLAVSLIAAVVAFCSGFALLLICLAYDVLSRGNSQASSNTAALAYATSVFSVPAGVCWGLALSVWQRPSGTTWRDPAAPLFERGLGAFVIAGTISAIWSLVDGLVRYGYDDLTIGFPGLCAAFVFLGTMLLLAAWLVRNDRGIGLPNALLYIVATVGDAIMLALGLYIPLAAVSTLLKGSTWIFHTWNVLVFFYPVYFILSLGIGGALLFYGGKLFAWTSSRPPP
jgi:hypothetical protein